MTDFDPVTAPRDSWTVAVYSGRDASQPLGAGVVVGPHEVLTCAHVVAKEWGRELLWVCFPKAGLPRTERREVRDVRRARAGTDAAILVLAQPVPDVVTPAALRAPSPADLMREGWWAFGFPDGAELGSEAHGVVGGALAWGWISLHRRSRYPIGTGFSGAGLWSPRYQAVVGLIGEARVGGEFAGDGRAITIHQIEQDLPAGNTGPLPTAWSLPDADDSTLAAWGWSLDRDAEARRHWRPRARGVAVDSEQGYRFSGRRAALTDIVSWLDRSEPDRRVLVVIGSPGIGKSAVLGRIVTTADAGIRAALPPTDRHVKASLGSVACAIHAKGKTALDVAVELARAASVRLPLEVEDVVPALRDALVRRLADGRRFNIVVDALDEAASPVEVRLILSVLLFPIVQTCSDVGAQVVIGTRRADDGGDLLAEFGPAGRILDLDDTRYFAEEDLTAYALATLQLVGAERAGNPYADGTVAQPVAQRIAALAERNFLIAGLVARTHGSYDVEPVDPDQLAFTPTVDAALADYLRRLAPVGDVPASLVLTALAYASGQGFSTRIWSVALRSMSARIRPDRLLEFTRSAAANFLVDVTHEAGIHRFRLFHQALNDALLRERQLRGDRSADERNMTRWLIEYGRRFGWDKADSYLLRSLPVHASRAGMVDVLLLNDDYLLHADLLRLTSTADQATTPEGRARGRLLRLTPRAVAAAPYDRAALLGLTQRMERLGGDFAAKHPAPYRVRWAAVTPRTERAALEGHANQVNAVCPVVSEGRVLLASASDDWTIRLWDTATGSQERVLRGHTRGVTDVCAIPVQKRQMLASLGEDGAVRLWDPASPHVRDPLLLTLADATAMCAVPIDDGTALAVGDAEGSVVLWDPVTHRVSDRVTGAVRRPAYPSPITHLCPIKLRGRHLLACAHRDGLINLWDPRSGQIVHEFQVLASNLVALFALCYRNKVQLVAGCAGGSVWIWTWREGSEQAEPRDSHIAAFATMCPAVLDGELRLATGDESGVVKLWTMPKTDWAEVSLDREVGDQRARVSALCSFTLGNRTYLASAGDDRTVRLWDPTTGREESGLADRAVRSLCEVPWHGTHLVAGISTDAVWLWEALTGERQRAFQGNATALTQLAAVPAHFLAAAAEDGTIRLWDLATYSQVRMPLATHTGPINAVHPVSVHGRVRLVSAGSDGWIRVWDLEKWRLAILGGSLLNPRGHPAKTPAHNGQATAVATVRFSGRAHLATAGEDHVLRLWDLESSRIDRPVQSIDMGRGHIPAALCDASVGGRALLATAGQDRTIRVWDPESGTCEATLTGHTDRVSDVCRIDFTGRPLLASTSADRTVRLWSLDSGIPTLAIPVYHPALTCVTCTGLLIVGLTAGIIAIDIAPDGGSGAGIRRADPARRIRR